VRGVLGVKDETKSFGRHSLFVNEDGQGI